MTTDGGLAFPGKRWQKVRGADGMAADAEVEWSGMSLRDYFAGQLAAPLMSVLDDATRGLPKATDKHEAMRVARQLVAEEAYAMADALLAERSRRLATPTA
jgi:hypothetical protein